LNTLKIRVRPRISKILRRVNQARPNIIKDEKGDLVTDCHIILSKWRNISSQTLSVHGFNDV